MVERYSRESCGSLGNNDVAAGKDVDTFCMRGVVSPTLLLCTLIFGRGRSEWVNNAHKIKNKGGKHAGQKTRSTKKRTVPQ